MTDKHKKQNIEAILFIAGRPLSVKKIAGVTGLPESEVKVELELLRKQYDEDGRGIAVVKSGSTYQMTTAKETSKIVADYSKEEVSGELTKPSLEALTIIAYRGPVKKVEIEQIRGVNCSVIIRNLLIRGLIEEERRQGEISSTYSVTTDFLKYIGLTNTEALPEYSSLSSNVSLETFLGANSEKE
jgi:segregation and condensation protein B